MNRSPISNLLPNASPDLTVLGQRCDVAALAGQRQARWRPGLGQKVLHSEIFASAAEGSGAGLALAMACDALRGSGNNTADNRKILWVQDRKAMRLGGRPYRHGLPREWRDRLIYVEASDCEDALFALEEGLRCRDLAFVIGEIGGNPRALGFTASRRLSLTVERYGVPLWLVRLDARPDLSSARMRWTAKAHPSPPAAWDDLAPGAPCWQAELFRSRSHAPGTWVVHSDGDHLAISGDAQRKHHPGNMRIVGNAYIRKYAHWKARHLAAEQSEKPVLLENAG